MATGFANIRRPGYETETNVEQIPEVRRYGTRPKYQPVDYTGAVVRKSIETPTTQTSKLYQDGGTGVRGRVGNLVGKIFKGNMQVKVSKNYNKSQDMIEEGRRSPISQAFRAREVMRLSMMRPIHNPTRKMYEDAYSQPIQEYGFAKTRQMNPPAAQRALNRGQTQVQPNLKNPQPTQNIGTAMPWDQ